MSEEHACRQTGEMYSPVADCLQSAREEVPFEDDLDDSEWEQIMADAEEDERLGVKPAFSTTAYPDHQTAMRALDARIHDICERAIRRAAASEP